MSSAIKRKVRLLVLGGTAALLFTGASASEAKYFRSDGGVTRSGGPLPDQFDKPESLAWRVPMDGGRSSPMLQGGKLFLTAFQPESKELATVALDPASGRVLWRRGLVPQKIEQTHRVGSPATATMASDGERVFAFFGSVGLFCYDLDGHSLWEQRLGPFRDEYGAGSSPILINGKVIINQDHDIDSFVAAFDSSTGRLVWKIPRPDAVRSYATPTVWNQGGKPQLVVAGALQLTGYDPENGERLWWVNGLARIVIPTPVASGPTIYMASWAPGGDPGKRISLDAWTNALAKWDANHDGKLAKTEIDDPEVLDRFNRMDLDQDGLLNQPEWERHAAVFRRAQNAVLALQPKGRGELGDDVVLWKHNRGVPYVASPVLDHGILWMVKEGGIVTKLQATTGQLLQEERIPGIGNYFASPVSGDDKIYFASESGTLSVVAATTEWKVISSHDFHERIYATPVLDGDHLYLRTEQAIYCFRGARP